MAEIKNYTLNFSFGRALGALNFADAKLACTEVQRAHRGAKAVSFG